MHGFSIYFILNQNLKVFSYSLIRDMSSVTKSIRRWWCRSHVHRDNNDDGYNYAPTAWLEAHGNGDDDEEYEYAPAASEGDDDDDDDDDDDYSDDDDGDYDYAPAA
ncbi:unnamed protein product [Lactuca saligna]|uniref:Uncharacterized protein n=1 Tax=Lactuca saligna TaxID=75948 RepID=A0AA35VLR8_LACSI|nr:unnamed protein product [Lactuca saligna]